jgi:hypothetical protein
VKDIPLSRFRISPLEHSMATHTRTRSVSAPAYYLGRPAVLWLAALATHKPHGASCVGDSVLFIPGQH